MLAFIKRFLMHYGIYRRYPLGRFPALSNAWRAAQPDGVLGRLREWGASFLGRNCWLGLACRWALGIIRWSWRASWVRPRASPACCASASPVSQFAA